MPTGLEAGKSAGVVVWDVPTRLFHWTLVVLIALSWISADRGLMKLHLWSGSAMLTLLIFRVSWGFLGSTTARFSDFVAGPARVIGYFRGMARGHTRPHAGHNPAGGWMVLVMLMLLLLQACTGLFSNDGLHFNGPLANEVSAEMSDRLTVLHGNVFNFILLMVWVHVVAVLFYYFVGGENLIAPMVHGKKPRAALPSALDLKISRLPAALLCLAVAAGLVWWIVRP